MRKLATLFIAIVASVATLSAQQIVADGGSSSAKAPRNTIAALETAAVGGYMVKCDVNIAEDGTIVVVEGPWLGEKSDPDRLNVQRSDYATLSSKLLANGEAVPTLDAYLDKVAALEGLRLIIEIKEHATPRRESEVVKAVVAKVKERKLQDRVDYLSVRQHICNELVRMAASAATIYYAGNNLTPEYAEGMNYKGIAYTVDAFKRIPRWVDEARKLGLKVAIRGVVSTEDAAWAAKCKADIIISTAPATVKKSVK